MARFTITLSDDMHQKLKEQAERDHRTLGQEIAYLIELYVPTYQKNRPIITSDYI
jgi:predicted transcriptional regulator